MLRMIKTYHKHWHLNHIFNIKIPVNVFVLFLFREDLWYANNKIVNVTQTV